MTAKDYEKLADEAERGLDFSKGRPATLEEDLRAQIVGMQSRLARMDQKLAEQIEKSSHSPRSKREFAATS
jgi:hypothetical protein